MNFSPWRKRTEVARNELDEVRCQRQQVQVNRRIVDRVSAELRRHDETNGWTALAMDMFKGNRA